MVKILCGGCVFADKGGEGMGGWGSLGKIIEPGSELGLGTKSTEYRSNTK